MSKPFEINIETVEVHTQDGRSFLESLEALVNKYSPAQEPESRDPHSARIKTLEERISRRAWAHHAQSDPIHERDLKKFSEGLRFVASTLRAEKFSEGQVRAALLSICGVRVDDSLVRHLMLFQ